MWYNRGHERSRLVEELVGEINIEELAEFRARFNKPQRVRESIFTGWTQDAYNCWESNHNCSRCPIHLNYNMKDQCKMRDSVNELLRVYGKPTKSEYKEGSKLEQWK